jgi:cell wall-associated NlpC family hydrolase
MGASTLAFAASILAGPAVSPAAADPPLTVAEAKAQVDQLEIDAAAIDDQAVGVKEKLDLGNKQLVVKQADVTKQKVRVARIRQQVGQVALAQFQNRNLDTTAQLFFTQDTDGFLNKISTVEKVSENQNTVLQDYQAEQAHLADLERSAKVDVAALNAQDQELTKLRAASATKIADSKAVLARLTEEERQRIAAEEKAAEEAAQKAAEAKAQKDLSSGSSNSNNSNNSGSGQSDPTPTKSVRSTGKGAIALAFAKRQLGKPYVFSADGPNAYDCSGLTSAAWRHAGVSIPRTSRAQSVGGGRTISQSELQPGDLVFFYHPVSHVALYAGNGMVIHAPRPGRTVTYIKMSHMPYAGARRPG